MTGGNDVMATAAQRAQKKDLGPDWRETLSASIRGFLRKTFGVMLVGLSIALGVALITHSSVDPSLTTAAGGPPTNWLGSFGAYSSDALLFLFGPAAGLFLPLVALAGLRMIRGADAGRIGRAILVAALGVGLIGIADLPDTVRPKRHHCADRRDGRRHRRDAGRRVRHPAL